MKDKSLAKKSKSFWLILVFLFGRNFSSFWRFRWWKSWEVFVDKEVSRDVDSLLLLLLLLLMLLLLVPLFLLLLLVLLLLLFCSYCCCFVPIAVVVAVSLLSNIRHKDRLGHLRTTKLTSQLIRLLSLLTLNCNLVWADKKLIIALKLA